jgi:23S rRNA pseudouridine1911/1915/1917 synthase
MSKEPLCYTYAGQPARLDKVIAGKLEGVATASRSQVERWIESGAVLVNGMVVTKPAYKVEEGDQIAVKGLVEAPTTLTPYDFPLEIVYEDSNLLVLNKPAGISMHPGAGNRERTIANAVVQHVGGQQRSVGESDRPGIVHRLDKDTTGVVVVAKSTPVHAALSKQFAERSIERSYRALVFTTPRAKRLVQLNEEGEISNPIGRHPTKRKLMAISEKGKGAVTHWRVIERFAYGTLIECRLETGRTHQIRVHMNSIGCPVIGDTTYGDFSNLPAPLREAAERFGRQALHAETLAFTHPTTNKKLSFSAELPADFKVLLDVFRAYR